MITIELDSIDISNEVVFNSLIVIQNLTNEVDTAEFSIRKYGSRTTTPAFDNDVVIQDGGVDIFAGKVMDVEQSVEAGKGQIYKVKCVDHTAEFDRVLASRTYTSSSVSTIIADLVTSYATGFTTNNVDSDFVIPKIVFNQLPLSECLTRLAKIVSFDWYIDSDKDVHFFSKEANTAPFTLTDTNGNYKYKTLKRTSDGSQVVNTVKVRGGEYNGDTFTDTITVSGNNSKSFQLPYKFANLTIELDTGAGFVSKNVGVDFIDDFTSDDVLHNFQDQSFRFENPLADGDLIRFSGNPKVPVLAIAQDSDSIAQYGTIEKLLRDNSIESNEVARKRASAELLAYAETVTDVSFDTNTSGLRAGQLIEIDSTERGIDDELLIKRLVFTADTPFDMTYRVSCISTQRYTLIDLLRQIIKPQVRKEDERETSETLFAVNEEVTNTESISVVNPVEVDETVTNTDSALLDPVDPANVTWVYGYYAPSSQSDTKRMAKYDRDAKYQ